MKTCDRKPSTILYSHASSLVGGGNKVLLRIFERLDRASFSPVSVIPERGPLEEELQRRDVPYFVLDLRATHQSKWTQAVSLVRLALRNARWRPRLIHANETPYRSTALGSPCSKRICHVHHPGSTADGLRWLFRASPDLVITPSHFVKEEVEQVAKQSGIRLRVEVVWNPIDLEWFTPAGDKVALRESLQMDCEARHVSILGALAPHKGHACFLRMAQEVLAQHPESRFHIVGGEMGRDTSYRDRLVQLAGDLGIGDRVRFWGFVDDRTARDVVAASDLFVLPTTEEGFGLVVAEAQACEVPVLTSSIRPLDEVVDDGNTGFLLPPDSHHEFAVKAIGLLGNPSDGKRMGVAGRQWVESRFSHQAHVDRLTSLYEELLGTNSTQAEV